MCAPCARCDNGLFIIGFDNDRYRCPSALCAHHVPRKPCAQGSGLRPQRAPIGAVLLSPLRPQPCPCAHAHPPPWFVLAVVCAARTEKTLRLGLRAQGAEGLHWRGFALPSAPSALPQAACPPTTLVVCLSASTFNLYFLPLSMFGVYGGGPPCPPGCLWLVPSSALLAPWFLSLAVALRAPDLGALGAQSGTLMAILYPAFTNFGYAVS